MEGLGWWLGDDGSPPGHRRHPAPVGPSHNCVILPPSLCSLPWRLFPPPRLHYCPLPEPACCTSLCPCSPHFLSRLFTPSLHILSPIVSPTLSAVLELALHISFRYISQHLRPPSTVSSSPLPSPTFHPLSHRF